jgi:hypothetical protein
VPQGDGACTKRDRRQDRGQTEPAGEVQVPPQGPPAIKQRAIAVQQTVAGGIAPRLAGTSGFQQPLNKLKVCLDDDVISKRELDWQRNIKADRTKQAAFKDKARMLQKFSAFLVMRLGYLTCIHSAHVYHSLAAVPSENDGEFIGFIGDRTPTNVPIPIKLPPLATFEWKQVNGVDTPDGLDNEYEDQPPGQL